MDVDFLKKQYILKMHIYKEKFVGRSLVKNFIFQNSDQLL
jgi:hypothetical protein